jgi:hypothetical protein
LQIRLLFTRFTEEKNRFLKTIVRLDPGIRQEVTARVRVTISNEQLQLAAGLFRETIADQ